MSSTNYSNLVTFHDDLQIMEVNFNDVTFENSPMVDDIYDAIEQGIADSGSEKWFFMVNYKNCRIFELAWIRFAQRGKRVNIAHSLGSVRFAAHEDLGHSIEASAKSQNFDPNLFATREQALGEIEKMKQNQ